MSKKEKVELIVEGGKAGVTPAMGQQFGPMGVNIQAILTSINNKTSDFKGMKVPVKILVDIDTKDFELEIGTPPVSELIKKEIGLEKGSGSQDINKIGNLAIEQIIKIARMKKDSMLANNSKSAIKSIIGTCNSMGVLVEGEEAKKIVEKINQGHFDKEINSGKIEVSSEKKHILKTQLEDALVKIKAEQEKLEAAKKAKEGEAGEVKEGEEAATAESSEKTEEATSAKPAIAAKPAAAKPKESKPAKESKAK